MPTTRVRSVTLIAIDPEVLRLLTGAAEAYADDLTTGLADGTYEDGADTLPDLDEAIIVAKQQLKELEVA